MAGLTSEEIKQLNNLGGGYPPTPKLGDLLDMLCNATGNEDPALAPAGTYTLYVDNVTGSDDTGDGSLLLPFATENRAVDAIPAIGDLGLRKFIIRMAFTGVPYPLIRVGKIFNDSVVIEAIYELEASIFSGSPAWTPVSPGVYEANIGAHPGFVRGEAAVSVDASGFGPQYPENWLLPILDSSVSPNIRVAAEFDPTGFGAFDVRRLQTECTPSVVAAFSASRDLRHDTNARVMTVGARINCEDNDYFGGLDNDAVIDRFFSYYCTWVPSAGFQNIIVTGAEIHGALLQEFGMTCRGGASAAGVDIFGSITMFPRGDVAVNGAYIKELTVTSASLGRVQFGGLTLWGPATASGFAVAVRDSSTLIIGGGIESEGNRPNFMQIQDNSHVIANGAAGSLVAPVTTSTTILLERGSSVDQLLAVPTLGVTLTGPLNNEIGVGSLAPTSFATFTGAGGSNDFAAGAASQGCRAL